VRRRSPDASQDFGDGGRLVVGGQHDECLHVSVEATAEV
jgi:hypothetical protein